MFRPVCVSLILFATHFVVALAADPPGLAPIPTQIAKAKRVFVSNVGGECQDFNSPGLNFGSSGQPLHHGRLSAAVPTPYDGLYWLLKDWGRFELVLDPSEADLAFQIHLICPSNKESHPVLELQILDPKTRLALWGFTETAAPAELQKNRDANFERAMARLAQDLKALIARADSSGTHPK